MKTLYKPLAQLSAAFLVSYLALYKLASKVPGDGYAALYILTLIGTVAFITWQVARHSHTGEPR